MPYLSPAKINLSLRVLGKRADGYHELDTRMCAVSLFDELTLTEAREDSLTCSDDRLTSKEENLAWRAVELFRAESPYLVPVHLHLEKKIPLQAGLGGGSSNAATALFALNDLVGRPFTISQLRALGANLGSDVPFFFSSGSARCGGRGEKVEEWPLPKLPEIHIFKPDISLSTPLVFGKFQPGEDREGLHFNALENAAFQVAPQLAHVKRTLLEEGYDTVVLCGSGSAFYCLGPGRSGTLVSPVQRNEGSWYNANETLRR